MCSQRRAEPARSCRISMAGCSRTRRLTTCWPTWLACVARRPHDENDSCVVDSTLGCDRGINGHRAAIARCAGRCGHVADLRQELPGPVSYTHLTLPTSD